MQHSMSCQCGQVKGVITDPKPTNHAICFCKDCQAFPRYLGVSDRVLDEQGGSDVVQMPVSALRFHTGQDQICVLRLSPTGLMRWYAGCCQTPIGNSLPNPKMDFIGVISSILDEPKIEIDFGPVRQIYKGASAYGEPKPKDRGFLGALLTVLRIILPGWIGGRYRCSPFYKDGGFIVEPKILTEAERAAITSV